MVLREGVASNLPFPGLHKKKSGTVVNWKLSTGLI